MDFQGDAPVPGTAGAGRADDEPDAALCACAHPLLEGVRCQRMRGHPGRHGALVDSSSAEITLSWSDDDPADLD